MTNHEHRRFLYNDQGVVVGYQCSICEDLIRTASGFKQHIFRKHGINQQQVMFKEEEDSHVNLDCYEPEINAA